MGCKLIEFVAISDTLPIEPIVKIVRDKVEILKHFDGGIKYFDSPRFSNTLTVW